MTRPNDDDAGLPVSQSAYDPAPRRRGGYQRQGIGETVLKSFLRAIAQSLGRYLMRMLLGRR
jgi:hypothetical protein